MASRTWLVVGLVVTGAALPNRQQQPQQPQAYWYISYYQIDWPKVDSLRKLVRTYTLPIVEEQKKLGVLLEYRMLIHTHANRENVVIARKLANWAAVERDTTFGVAYRRVVPDSVRRSQISGAFSEIFGAGLHRDEIYQEVTR